MTLVGIIANPSSGRDIRRLVAHGSTFDNAEKVNIVRRLLLALDALGIEQVRFMPDPYGVVERAIAAISTRIDAAPLPMPVLGDAGDSLEAAQRLRDLGATCIVTLGGDGTNRVVAKGCGDVPLVAISTGTNNVFPSMIEGTLAGFAAGFTARAEVDDAVIRQPRLIVEIDGEMRDQALIDVVVSRQSWIGARAVWTPDQIVEVVLSRIDPAAIGLCGLGGAVLPELVGRSLGAHLVIGGGNCEVMTALAPGLVSLVPIEDATPLNPGDSVRLQPLAGALALDGEREIELRTGREDVRVILDPDGPRLVDVTKAIRLAAAAGAFQTSAA